MHIGKGSDWVYISAEICSKKIKKIFVMLLNIPCYIQQLYCSCISIYLCDLFALWQQKLSRKDIAHVLQKRHI